MITRATTAIQDAWDTYLRVLYYPITCLIFLLVVVYNWWYGQKLADDWEQWTITEWLISYAPGFVRRGLGGEILLFVHRQTGWPLNTEALWTFVGLFAIFFLAFAILLLRRRMTFWFFVLCLSPGFVLFTFYNPPAVGRKELLVFVAFAVWTLLSAGQRWGVRFHLAFGAAAFFLTLMHEMFFFFTPYFVLLAYLEARQAGTQSDLRWLRSLLVPVASGIATLIVLGFSASLEDPTLCDRLVLLGAPPKVCGGVLAFHNPTLGEAWAEFAGLLTGEMYLRLLLILPIVLAPFYLFLTANATGTIAPLALTGLEALMILFSAPLFVIAVDWGRWMSIHVVLSTLLCAALLPRRGAPRPVQTFSVLTLVGLLAGGVILSSLLGWSLKYCCRADYLTTLGPVDAIVGTWEEF